MSDSLRWHDIYIYIYYDDQFRHSINIKVITSIIWEDALLVLLMIYIYIYIWSMPLRWAQTEVQEILRFYFSNLTGYNVGITGICDLWNMLLRVAWMPWYIH
jgi:hypothetical protein